MTRSSPETETVDVEALARRVETTPVDGKFGTRLFAMSDAERDLVVRLLRSHWDHTAEYVGFGHAQREQEQTAVERFQKRVVEMIQAGCTGFHFMSGSKWHSLTIEEKCAAMLEVWDAPAVETGPPRTSKEPVDIRRLVESVSDTSTDRQ